MFKSEATHSLSFTSPVFVAFFIMPPNVTAVLLALGFVFGKFRGFSWRQTTKRVSSWVLQVPPGK
jgi:hypothetical protein